MDERAQFQSRLAQPEPLLALAPMHGITCRAFWSVLPAYGGADFYVTEYCRVHAVSHIPRPVLDSIQNNPTNRPVVAQMMGRDIPSLVRIAQELQRLPVAAVDLNLGCPVPVVRRKGVGGGLLLELQHIDDILKALREAITIPFTLKTRLGFASADDFHRLMEVLARHRLDLLAVHGRTVTQLYSDAVRYDLIAQAAATLPYPVLINGDIVSARQAQALLAHSRARGLMLGRGAVRNPWLFAQIRSLLHGEVPVLPTGREVLAYIHQLYDRLCSPGYRESSQVERLKKYMNYFGEGVDAEGRFLHEIRRVETRAGFFGVCQQWLDHDQPMALEPLHRPALIPGEAGGG